MTQPAPLTPPDADLQDFPFMPLHVARLRDSDLAAEGDPEGCWYAVLLWAAAWHQLPAGSLPDNDAVLTKLCGLGRDLRTFRKHRRDALRGFVTCDDGRLYHPVIAEQVMAGWDGKLRQRYRTECATIKKRNDRAGVTPSEREPRPLFGDWLSLNHPASVPFVSLGTDDFVPRDNVTKGKREGQGQGDIGSEADASGAEAPALPVIVDPDKVMFDGGISLMARAGVLEPKARQLLGKWKRDHGTPSVIAALGAAQREGAIDPTSFIERALRNGQRPDQQRRGNNGFLNAIIDAERDDRARQSV
ncbi:DUF1376 domain-containing protein [Sphingomonas faeni]|uniref:DUF1376 domain-containing protein n=1 Tax=Sphingomonas faeni TaxID=185950 RepID=UPI00335C731D